MNSLNHKMKVLVAAMIFAATLPQANAGGDKVGGGGDALEVRVNEIRADLLSWIEKGGSRSLVLPPQITLSQYNQTMSAILQPKAVIIGFVEQDDLYQDELKVSVDGIPKTCRGFQSVVTGLFHILCNISRFKNTDEAQQYALIHHEYAGLVSIEKNEGAASDYAVSGQITSYLSPTSVLKLAVKPLSSGSTNYGAIYVNDDGSISIVAPHFKNPTGAGNMNISNKSDLNGVCSLFGLGKYVPSSHQNSISTEETVNISAQGRFDKFEWKEWPLKFLSCLPKTQTPAPVSVNFKSKTLNDDGSYTLVQPQFKLNGDNYSITSQSSLSGVCKLFGFSQFVDQSIKVRYNSAFMVNISAEANFKIFNSTVQSGGWPIASIICR